MSHPGDTLPVVNQALRERRTVNFFQPDAVDPAVIEAAVRAARWAPNHRLTEPWQFFHLGPQTRQALIDLAFEQVQSTKGAEAAEARRQRMEAVPDWLVITYARADDALVDRENYAATCCAAQNLMLYLSSAGLGSKWTTGPVTRDPALPALLGVDPARHEVVGVFWIGYPKAVPASRRGPLAQVFHSLR